MEPEEEIARILLDSKTKQVLDITLYEENLRFKCRRCATFCCKLGGPKLTKKDIKRIEQAGHNREEFLIPFKGGSNGPSLFLGSLKSKQDGSCIFLRFNQEGENYSCETYDSRPALCRLYPFDPQKINSQSIILRLIPCCRGLNTEDGAPMDEKLVLDLLKVADEIL